MKYEHGGDVYRNLVDYDFSININPLGMPAKAKQAACDGISLVDKYPDYRGDALLEEISKTYNVNKDGLLLGNGAAELIYTLCRAQMPKKALSIAPTFSEYENAVRAVGGKFEYHYLDEKNDYVITESLLDDLYEDVDIFFLCNPNNPTGSLIDSDLMLRVCERCKEFDILLCVDESFLPFVREGKTKSIMGMLDGKSGRVIVLRSFTKIYAMPGLRLGYVYSNDHELIEKMYRVNQPWTTSTPAQLAGAAAIKDEDYLVKTYDQIESERAYLQREMEGIIAGGRIIFKQYPSDANYIMFEGEEDLYDRLFAEGFMIRNLETLPGLRRGFYRIGVREHRDNQALIQCLKRL